MGIPTEHKNIHERGMRKKGRLRPILLERENREQREDEQTLREKQSPLSSSEQAGSVFAKRGAVPLVIDCLPIDQQPTQLIPVLEPSPVGHADPTKKESYGLLIRSLLKSSGIYALASLASPFVSLVLAPFLTRHLSSSQYGALAVITTAISLIAGISQLGLGSAFFRAYSYDYETESDKRAVLSTVVLLLLCISAFIVIAVLLSSSWIAVLLVNDSSFGGAVAISVCVVLLQNLSVPGFSWLRAEQRPGLFTTLSILNLLVGLGGTIVLVGVLHMGIAGALLATGGGYGVVVLGTLPLIFYRSGFRLRIDIARGLLAFGVPNAASFISIWVLQLSDRYLLSYFGSLAQTASYAVAYSLGGVLSTVIIAPFSLAWPSTMYTIAKKEHAVQTFGLVFRWFGFILLFAAYSFSLVGIGILHLFFPSGYHSASPIIPIIAASILFYGVHIFFTLGISIRRKTWLVVLLTFFAAITNIAFNLILIPHFGAMGAAWSTLFAYAVLALITLGVNQRIYPVPFDIGLFVVALLAGIALFLGDALFTQALRPLFAWVIHGSTLSLYGGGLLLLGKLPMRGRNSDFRWKKEKILS